MREAAMERAEDYRMHVEWALRQLGVDGNRPANSRACFYAPICDSRGNLTIGAG